MKKLLLSFLCLFAAIAVNAAKEVDLPINEGWGNAWNATAEYADNVVTITLTGAYGAGGYWVNDDWSKYDRLSVVIEEHRDGWGQILIRNKEDQDIFSTTIGSVTAGNSKTFTVPFDPTQATAIGRICIQGAGEGDIIKVSKVYLTKATFYEDEPYTTLAVANENPHLYPASLFEGFADTDVVKFTVDIQGSANYGGWGIGELTTARYLATAESNWQPIEGAKIWTVGGGKDGLASFSISMAELRPFITKEEYADADGNLGVLSNMYGQGGGECTVTLKSIEVFKVADPVDFVLNIADGEEIIAAINSASIGKKVGKLTINLPAEGTAKLKKSLEVSDNLIINGNNATIELAEGMADPIVTLDETDAFALKADGTESDHKAIESVVLSDLTVAGLKGALIKDAQKTLLENLLIDNCFIEMPAKGKNVIDFTNNGYVGKVTVTNSTIWANGKNTGFFAQYGSRPKNVNGDWLQEFDVENSTIVNIANGKNFCDLKQKGTAQNVYTLKNSIFVDCGKNGQTVVGFNSGQPSATPVWDVTGNYFAWDGVATCTNDAEIEKAGKKDGIDIVQNCIYDESFPPFADGSAEIGSFDLLPQSAYNLAGIGDPRWVQAVDIFVEPDPNADIATELDVVTEGIAKIGDITITLEKDAEYTISKTLTIPNNLTVLGNFGKIVVPSTMKDPLITLDGTENIAAKPDGTETEYKAIETVSINQLVVTGLQNALIKDNQKTQVGKLLISESNIEVPASSKTFIDFNSKGYIGEVSVNASTIWSKGKHTGFFAQYGGRPKDFAESTDYMQKFEFSNSTIVNIANGKNFCDLKQVGTKQNSYTLGNNIFVDCGKEGQTVVGFNKGQPSATPEWEVIGNYFAWGDACKNEAEIAKAGKKGDADIVQACVDGLLTFTDAANGDFNGTFELADDAEQPQVLGAPEWEITYTGATVGISTVKADTNANTIYNLNGQQMNGMLKSGLYIVNGKKVVIK